ncbi:MAG TPA: hypothetical protein PLM79_06065 [Syntrophobacteraceae bacterium]|nr:hypothetical protein [Syntrophobacteraceae bacterium]
MTSHKGVRFRSHYLFRSVLVAGVLLCFAAFSAEVQGDRNGLYQLYLKAVDDAKTVNPHKISRNLVAITKGNPNLPLRWEGVPEKSRVLVVTWTDKDYYDDYVGRDYVLPPSANVWVTAVPELKEFVRKHVVPVPPLRVEQLLGLPPHTGKTKFVEIWADRKSLFRPSPDPEITDHEAELRFPTKVNPFLKYDPGASMIEWNSDLQKEVKYTYPEWFNHRKRTIYTGDSPYPWTRLGYTYDWGNVQTRVGLSEFVILGGSTVGIHAVRSNAEYLNPALLN